MLKLNEKGWGYGFLFFFAALFILILVGTAIAVNSLIKKNKSSDSTSTQTNKNYAKMYSLLEDKLKNSGEYYVLDNEAYFNNKNESTRMSVTFLKNYGYIDDLADPESDSSCEGFVIVTADKKVTSYIKCYNYKTENYDSWS